MREADTQRCGSCKRQLPHSAFTESYIGKVGTWCLGCHAAHARGEREHVGYDARPCSICGKDYIPKQIKTASLNTCSRKCKDKARRRRQKEQGTCGELDRRQNIKRLYGISLEQYSEMLAAQNGGCAICGQRCSTYENLSVDHDHKTGEIRSLLCNRHNRGLGFFNDDPNELEVAAAYIRRHRSVLDSNAS